ncbi:hypothetical protein HQ586_03975 [Candidatus Bathyarchaeota archaeon]|nr:hypothetical protein [Candidatus Bathyarchaeota archaeon]
MKRIRKAALLIAGILVIAIIGFYIISTYTSTMLFPEVWSQNSPYGASYEFKVNDAPFFKNELEAGYLSTVDRVVVTDPKGRKYELERDFNINEYSGEVTRRFVLYGPPDGGLPESGKYRFAFIKEGKTVSEKTVDYEQSKLGYPSEVRWERRREDLFVEWSPPPDVDKENWYKVIVWDTEDNWETPTSLVFDWDASDGLLESVPFIENRVYQLEVAIFSGAGYAYSEYHYFIWDLVASRTFA